MIQSHLLTIDYDADSNINQDLDLDNCQINCSIIKTGSKDGNGQDMGRVEQYHTHTRVVQLLGTTFYPYPYPLYELYSYLYLTGKLFMILHSSITHLIKQNMYLNSITYIGALDNYLNSNGQPMTTLIQFHKVTRIDVGPPRATYINGKAWVRGYKMVVITLSRWCRQTCLSRQMKIFQTIIH